MNMFSKIAVISSLVATTTFAVANTGVDQQALVPTQTTTVKQATAEYVFWCTIIEA